MSMIPILSNAEPLHPIFYYKGEIITHEKFMRDVTQIAASLEKHAYAINLTEDRYLFALGFVACMLLEQPCLMPASHAETEIKALEQDYSDTQRIDDNLLKILLASKTKNSLIFPEKINAEQLVAIVFTSGSTGKPKANHKHWGALVDSAQRVATQLKLNEPSQHTIVATVPPQHMYGFETTIIFPLVTGVCVHNSKPFFPEDVRQTLASIEGSTILVTTPIHLRACTKIKLDWPNVDFVLCATAPLTAQLAKDTEEQLQTTVHEIYGCSEVGVIATRTTTQDPVWSLLTDYKITERLNNFCITTPLSDQEILLPDQIEQLDHQHFKLLGRQSDLVKIAGKRGSLNDLKIKLCALEGVDDAVFFMPKEEPSENSRLAAFVVAPTLSIKEITDFFSQQVDHAFLPRPLLKVEGLPYNETGKLPRKNLIDLFSKLRNNKQLKNSA